MFIATPRSLWRAIALLALFGCGPDDPVVAQVGDVTLTKAEYLRFVERLPPGLQSEAALDHLQSLVDQELLLQEARARGIEQSNEVRYQLNALVRKQLSQRYQAEVLAPQVEVTPEEVERTFVDMGFDRERLFARILVRQQRDVDRVLQALHEGEPFAALAQRFAANDLFAPQGDGVVGWIGRTQAQRFAIPPQTFLSLPVGQIAEPLPLAGGWQIYRFVEDRPADKADYAQEAASAAHREKWQSRLQIEAETLSRSLDLQLNHEGLQALLATPNPADSLAALPLYRFDGGAISLGEYLYNLRSIGFRGALQDSAQVVSLARAALLPAYLMAVAAQRRGWDQEAEFAEWRERKRKTLVLQQLTKAETAAKAAPSEEEVAAYYEANKTRFRTAESVHINQLLAPTREQAQELRKPSQTAAPSPSCWPGRASKPTATRTTTERCTCARWCGRAIPSSWTRPLLRRSANGVGQWRCWTALPCSGCTTRRVATSNPSPKPKRERGPSWQQGAGTNSWTRSSNACAPSAQAKSPYSPSACKEVLLW